MSTRAKIGIVLDGGRVKSVNVWQDGYPDYCGQMLAKHYNSPEKIHDLMVEGNICELEKESNLCRYEKGTKPRIYSSLARFFNDHEGLDYIYIFSPDQGWQYINLNEK